MKLSVIVIAHNMARELPRSLQSLTQGYQHHCQSLNYEVIVVDNGSSAPIGKELVESFGPQFKYHYLKNPPPSPAYAINYGVSVSSGSILCFMIDGAHILTPGVFRFALNSFSIFSRPVVATRYFFLGPSEQNVSVEHGYDQRAEDALLEKISWPSDGYGLFDIGVPLQGDVPRMNWFNKMSETNCLFMTRELFAESGGAEERFDFPGGGFLNIDMYLRACEFPDVDPVILIGEGSFHQYHGGTTTNVGPEERDMKVTSYLEQFMAIRNHVPRATEKDILFVGHLPSENAKIHKLSHPYNN